MAEKDGFTWAVGDLLSTLKRHCAVILSYRAKYLPSRFKVPPLRLEIYRDLFTMSVMAQKGQEFFQSQSLPQTFWHPFAVRILNLLQRGFAVA